MVMHIYVSTNVRAVVQDAVDSMHNVSYDGTIITLKHRFGRDDKLDTSTGILLLGDIEYPENPIVK